MSGSAPGRTARVGTLAGFSPGRKVRPGSTRRKGSSLLSVRSVSMRKRDRPFPLLYARVSLSPTDDLFEFPSVTTRLSSVELLHGLGGFLASSPDAGACGPSAHVVEIATTNMTAASANPARRWNGALDRGSGTTPASRRVA